MKPTRRRFFATIPHWKHLSPDEQLVVADGGWPVRIADLLPEHLAFIDFLVAGAVEEWERSAGK